ncbi:hypothetical protein FG379_000197 [Cryptosporidium bovis]|uniref:uncharacterized protein n=1 Tax=Cryptosporidium bovis TaxID=310047 RepID=UPI00351A4EA4|nr:hypothetical protein FG379_000197 [Cryptosporidium bovis]
MGNKDDEERGNLGKPEIISEVESKIEDIIEQIESVTISDKQIKKSKEINEKNVSSFEKEVRRTKLITGDFQTGVEEKSKSEIINPCDYNFQVIDSLNNDTFFSVVPISNSNYADSEGNENNVEPPQEPYKGWYWNSEKMEYYLPSNSGRIKRRMYVSPKVFCKLKDHEYQYDGIRWLWDRFRNSEGGILADEMGLGKTVQVCVFLGGLFRSEIINFILIILPPSLISQWVNELDTWCPKIPKYIYHGSNNVRNSSLSELYKSKMGGILITTFETIRNDIEMLDSINIKKTECNYIRNKEGIKVSRNEYIRDLAESSESEFNIPWDIVVIDEAHKLKNNKTKLFRDVQNLKSYSNILCTGTPFQNRLTELWSLIQCVKPNLLGKNIKSFKSNYGVLIEKTNNKNIMISEMKSREMAMNHLKNVIKPYILRRNKKLVSSIFTVGIENDENNDRDTSKISKFDIVLWHSMSVEQLNAYEDVLDSQLVNNVLNDDLIFKKNNGAVLQTINLLLNVCRHPLLVLKSELQTWRYLLEKNNNNRLEIKEQIDCDFADNSDSYVNKDNNASKTDYDEEIEYIFSSVLSLPQISVELIRKQSTKLQILSLLVPQVVSTNKKLLIFTESLLMMDLIELTILIPNNVNWERLEGKQTLEQRKKSIHNFNNKEVS